jgi:hypothetical protein
MWEPVVHSRSRVDIPYMAVSYEPDALERWNAAYEPWLQSDRKDYSVWREYERARQGAGGFFCLFPEKAYLGDLRNFTRSEKSCFK